MKRKIIFYDTGLRLNLVPDYLEFLLSNSKFRKIMYSMIKNYFFLMYDFVLTNRHQ